MREDSQEKKREVNFVLMNRTHFFQTKVHLCLILPAQISERRSVSKTVNSISARLSLPKMQAFDHCCPHWTDI